MPKSSSFGYTNVTANAKTVAPVSLKVVTNYSRLGTDKAEECVLSNKTAPLDVGEMITYRANDLDKVTSTQQIQNPTPNRSGIQYVVKVEDILRTVDANGNIISDEPVVAYLTIRHQKSGNVTPAHVESIVSRVIGACQRADGTFRYDDLMRSGITPIAD